jgi:uncharacterized cupredoxin-like copper-binding protein
MSKIDESSNYLYNSPCYQSVVVIFFRRKVAQVQKPEKIGIHKSGALNSSQYPGKVLILLLALLMAACASATVGTSKSTPTPTSPIVFPTSGPVEQAAAPGSVEVKVTLVEFRIHSSVTVFHANTHYYFVVSNKGHDIHEFMIMPSQPDGSPLPPDEQFKGMLMELEPILPGSTWTTNFTFRVAGRYEIACQMGRHYLAGMRLPISVER